MPGVSLADAFGLVRVRRASRAEKTVLVLPRTVPVRLPFWEGDGARRTGDVVGAVRGRHELAGIRDYEPGDPLSIIHWGQTARRGRLQTKELHGGSGRTASVLIALDARAGAGPDDFETAVSAAASLAEACAAQGSAVGYVDSAGQADPVPATVDATAVVHRLAAAEPVGRMRLADVLARPARDPESSRLVVTVSAAPDPTLGPAVTRLRSRGIPVACVLVGPASVDRSDLVARGAHVTHVPEPAALEAALSAGGRHARS